MVRVRANYIHTFIYVLAMARQPLGGLLNIEASRSHSDTPHSPGLLWTSDWPDTETSTCQRTALTREQHPCPLRDSNLQSQQASGGIPKPYTARPLGSASQISVSLNMEPHACRSKWATCDLKRDLKFSQW